MSAASSLPAWRPWRNRSAYQPRQAIDFLPVDIDVQLLVVEPGDEQGRRDEIDLGIGRLEHLGQVRTGGLVMHRLGQLAQLLGLLLQQPRLAPQQRWLAAGNFTSGAISLAGTSLSSENVA